MAASVKKAAKPRKPIYFKVERLVRPSTGEEVGALVPRYPCDQRAMRERKYAIGTELRGELKKPRNAGFHRLAHSIGSLVVDQVEAFSGLGSHDAVKRLQRETGVCCEEMALDLGPLGVVPIKVPRSISFDEMEEGDFHQLVQAIYDHIAATYWPSLTADQVAQMAELYEGKH